LSRHRRQQLILNRRRSFAEAVFVEGGVNLFRQPQRIVAVTIGSGMRVPRSWWHLEISVPTGNVHSVANRVGLN
jgi:hypothetical protein